MLGTARCVERKCVPGVEFAFAVAVPLLFLPAGPAEAQSSRLKNIELCNSVDRTSSEPRIRGCTALILADGETPRILSVAYNNRGNAYVAEGEYDRAIQDYDQAIKVNPNYAKAFNNRGVAYARKGQHDLAVRDFNEAVKLDPDYAVAFANRAETYLTAGQHDRAAKDYDEAIRLKPMIGAAWNGRCRTHAAIGELQRALADCAEAVRLEPNAAALDSRGLVYLKLGQLDLAIDDYSAALQRDPKLAASLFGRGVAYSRKGETNRADADFAAAKAIAPNIAEEFARHGLK